MSELLLFFIAGILVLRYPGEALLLMIVSAAVLALLWLGALT